MVKKGMYFPVTFSSGKPPTYFCYHFRKLCYGELQLIRDGPCHNCWVGGEGGGVIEPLLWFGVGLLTKYINYH